MHRTILTLSIAIALAAACGAPPEPTIGTRFGLNGYSVPPPGGWGTEPWICSGPVGSYGGNFPSQRPPPSRGARQTVSATAKVTLPHFGHVFTDAPAASRRQSLRRALPGPA